MAPTKPNPTPLDVVFILFASVTLLLLLLWIATSLGGRVMFSNVPPWLTAMIASVWAKVSVAGGSVGAFLLRRYFDKSPAPNYLWWIPGFTMFLLLALVLVQIVVRNGGPQQRLANLLFNVDKKPNPLFQQKHIPDLDFWVQSPVEVPVHGVYGQTGGNPRYPYADVLQIEPDQGSTAYIKMTVDTSQASGASVDYDYKICLHPAPSPPDGGTPSGLLHCANGICSPVQGEDPGYVESCNARSPSSAGLVPVAFASVPAAQAREAGWVVPSLDTLEKMTDRERVGFTRFDVSFTPNETLAEANRYYFTLRVNDQPVYINGLLPERIHYQLQEKEKTNTISFALENLNFTGQHEGYEKLQLSVFFQQDDRLVRKQDLERNYVALRNAPEVVLPSELGPFRWSGTYVVPKNENKYEILLASARDDVRPAMAAKADFDQAKLTFKEKPVVMVVRPPLRQPPSYGLALGVVQPTSQVQFTFNAAEASELCQWVTGQVGKGTGGKLIRPDLRRYEIATQGYSACR